MRIVVGVTGASGLTLADSFLGMLQRHQEKLSLAVHLVVSANARLVASAEGSAFDPEKYRESFLLHDPADFSAPFASGSYHVDGMVIVPASMSTLGAIASGFGTNLVHRAADVCLKERRRLIVVPRETPFNLIHLENMTRLNRAGADIVPFIPSFYNKPMTITDMTEFFSLRLMDMLDIRIDHDGRWGAKP